MSVREPTGTKILGLIRSSFGQDARFVWHPASEHMQITTKCDIYESWGELHPSPNQTDII